MVKSSQVETIMWCFVSCHKRDPYLSSLGLAYVYNSSFISSLNATPHATKLRIVFCQNTQTGMCLKAFPSVPAEGKHTSYIIHCRMLDTMTLNTISTCKKYLKYEEIFNDPSVLSYDLQHRVCFSPRAPIPSHPTTGAIFAHCSPGWSWGNKRNRDLKKKNAYIIYIYKYLGDPGRLHLKKKTSKTQPSSNAR